jgi:hypothetical protein
VKYFTIQHPGSDGPDLGPFTGKGEVVRALDVLASLDGVVVTRWWWSHDDLVETEDFDARQFLATRSRDLNRGATAQWSAARGRL